MTRLIAILYIIILSPVAIITASGADSSAELYFISPADGETLQNPVIVRFGLKNMGVAPAGTDVANTGHHHLLIDAEVPDLKSPIGKDNRHRHFGGGQTEASLELSPGKHALQLLLGDFSHIPHNPPVISKRITITVE